MNTDNKESEEKHSMIIALDLCSDYSQIAFCMGEKNEPESISTVDDDQKYLIPTVVGYMENTGKWCIGDEALQREKRNESVNTGDIIKCILTEKGRTVGDKEYSGRELMEIFIKGLLIIVNERVHISKPDKIVVTLEYPDRILVNVIRQILEKFGFLKQNIRVIGHSESLIFYTIFQKKELWVNDVLVFDFTKESFMARRLNTVRARSPQPLIVEEIDMSDRMNIDELQTEQGRKQADKKFCEIINEMCSKHIVSTVFITGAGFYEKWMEESLSAICSKKRAFQGYNLFVKGAGYAALDMLGVGNAEQYQFVCTGRTLVNIELEVKKGDKRIPVILSKAGTNWYEAGARAEGILDNCNTVDMIISSSVSKTTTRESISLKEFPMRPNKTTRIEIILSYRNDRQCVILIKDMGFGEFFKASDKTIRKILNIEDYL